MVPHMLEEVSLIYLGEGRMVWRCVFWSRAPDLLKDHSTEAIVMVQHFSSSYWVMLKGIFTIKRKSP